VREPYQFSAPILAAWTKGGGWSGEEVRLELAQKIFLSAGGAAGERQRCETHPMIALRKNRSPAAWRRVHVLMTADIAATFHKSPTHASELTGNADGKYR